MSIIKNITLDLNEKIKEAGYDVENLSLVPSNRKDLGQYQLNDAMTLAKKYGKNPRIIASDIVNQIAKDNKYSNVNIAGPGFINISLSDNYLVEIANQLAQNIENDIDKEETKTIIIDYGGANVSKALHVGHLRSANIGEALKRLAQTLGHNVLGDAHLGDYGRPLGLVLLEIKKMYPDLAYFDESYQGDYSEVELKVSNKDLEEIYPRASLKAKEDEEYLEEAREITLKIQKHERGYYDLWKRVVGISKEDIKNVYDALNVHFELWQGESDAVEYFDELNKIFEEKQLLIDSEGAKIVELKEDTDTAPMPPLLFVKSNGSLSYQTTDLATILERVKKHNPDEIWYVTDARQSLHFNQVFRAARKAGLVRDDVVLEHIPFGTMNGKDGKPFKTRDGGVMSLKNLISLIKEETLKHIELQSITEEEKDNIAQIVAIAALKYADFIPFRGTDYIFEIEKFADLEGKTGSYILYSTIRMKSLLTKAKDLKQEKLHTLTSETEKEIILTALSLPGTLIKAKEIKSLNELADYLYKMSSLYNNFYSEHKILIEENKELQESWLVLTRLVYNINIFLLNILGIKVPEKM